MSKKRFIIILISSVSAVFIAGLLVFFFIFGNIAKNSPSHHFNNSLYTNDMFFTEIDKKFERQQKYMEEIDRDINKLINKSFNEKTSSFWNINNKFTTIKDIKTINKEENQNEYKITIDLKPFNNDKNNIDFKIKDNIVTVSGKYQQKDENNYSSSSFYESFNLTEQIKIKDIKEKEEKHKLIIIIPKERNK